MDQTPCECQQSGAVTRRGVLSAGVIVAGGLVLAGCGGGESASQAPANAPTPAPTVTGSVSGEKVVATGEVPVGGGVIVTTGIGAIVLTQPETDQYLAFGASCPHAGCTVNEVSDNTIHCPCHGSAFDASTGARTAGPAESGLPPVQIVIADGAIHLA